MTTHTHTPVLELTNTSVVYPDGQSEVIALDKANVQLYPKTMTALVGESGSGKSTLLSVAATLTTPTSGTVTFLGNDITAITEDQAAHLRAHNIGIVFQSPNLLGSLTAAEQLLITDHIRGLRGKAFKARRVRAEELLEQVGLGGFGSRSMSQLSGGQRQRVNIARALMGNPSLLLADEPTSALDHRLSVEIVELLRAVTHEFSLATLMVTHDQSQLELVDQVLEMRDGRLLDPTYAQLK